MNIMEILLKIANLKNLTPYLKSLMSMGRKSEVNFPKELIPLNLEVILKGLLTSRVFEVNSDWIYPYWMEEQLNPKKMSFVPRGANIFAINTTHRNWTILGFPDFDEKGVVDERGLISPRYNFPSLDIFVEEERFFFPSREKSVKQRVDKDTGKITTEFEKENFIIKIETFSLKEDMGIHVNVNLLSKKEGDFKVYFIVRPYNPESIIPVWDIKIKDESLFVNGKKFLIPDSEGYEFFILKDERDLPSKDFVKGSRAKSKYGLMSGGVFYNLSLKRGEKRELHIFLPQKDERINFKDIQFSKKLLKEFWENEKRKEIRIITPDERLNEIFEVNKIYLKSLINSNYITPGPLTYKHFWFRDSAYMLSALTKIGDFDRAGRILLHFPERERKGYFISQRGEWDSNGQAIWTMVEYFRFTRNREFLMYVYKAIRDGTLWIERKRKKYKESMGLLPPGFSAEHFGPNDLYYYDDYFGLKGILDASISAKELGFEKDYEIFKNFYLDFKRDIRRAIEDDQRRLNKKVVVGGFGRRIDASMISAFTSVFPLNLDILSKEEILNTYEVLREKFFVNGCFYQNITHSGINLYLTLEIAEALLYLGEEKEAIKLFESVLSLLKPTYTSPEAINPKTLGGCEGDGHHGWAIAEIIHFIRNMFILEKDKNLFILSGAKEDWFDGEKIITIKDAPTHFGLLSFNVKNSYERIEIEIDSHFKNGPKEILVRIPLEVGRVIEGNFKRREDNYFIFTPDTRKIIFERRS